MGAKKRSGKRKTIPSPETVVETFEVHTAKGKSFRILRTTQMDPYDKPVKPRKRKKRG